MYQQQITSILKRDTLTKTVFRGVYPVDILPKSVNQFPAAFIANTDESNEDGEHWVAFYFPSKERAEFFYSYGKYAHELDPRFLKFMQNICRRRRGEGHQSFVYNSQKLQAPMSNVCGHYCIYYIVQRTRGYSGNAIINQLGSDSLYSDFIVKYFIDKMY